MISTISGVADLAFSSFGVGVEDAKPPIPPLELFTGVTEKPPNEAAVPKPNEGWTDATALEPKAGLGGAGLEPNAGFAGAGLDVYEKEPLPENNKLRFLPNALLTPHIGYVTAENYNIFYNQMIEALEACVDRNPIRVIE